MNADHINPFVQGAQNTLGMIAGENPQLGALSLKKAPFHVRAVSIFVDIFGDLNGHVIFTLDTPDACKMASKMMCGMDVPSLDEISSSSLSELGNMIAGNIATSFSVKGISVDISTPRFKMDATSDDFGFVPVGKPLISIPLTFSTGLVFELDVIVTA
ncbi:MAG: chemotaxis protein CheX [Defluviitaleaceae bacterium]|nr:chemotaxis protein CheX [Defluviitaleaceae bacterium]